MSWIPLDYLIQKIKERRFSWITDSRLKYMQIRIDARDDRAILLDRDGKVVADNKTDLDEIFEKLNHEGDSNTILSRKVQSKFYANTGDSDNE